MAPEAPFRPQGTQANSGHEKRDVSAKWIFGLLLFLILCGVLIQALIAGVLRWLNHTPPPTDRWNPARPALNQTPPQPRLQLSPPADLAAFRAQEEAQLNSYGWVNQTSGIVRIPIDQAMELVLRKGLPVRPTPQQNQLGPSPEQLLRERLPAVGKGQP